MTVQFLLISSAMAGLLALIVGGQNASAQEHPLLQQTIRVGDTLYLSGQAGRNPVSGKHPTEMGAATRQAMLNLKHGLAAEGFKFSDVVSAQVWLTDLGKYQEMNSAYRSFFKQRFPTRTTLGVAALPGGSVVQIAMVAVKGPKKVIFPKGAKKTGLPFSPGILAGDTLYLSGHVGIDPRTGKLIEGDIGVHVNQTIKNIEGVLKAAGMDLSHVVSAYLYMENVDDFGAASKAYVSMFTQEPRPARLPMGVAALPLDSPVEITMIASRKSRRAVLGKDQPPSGNYSRGLLSGNVMHLAGVFQRKGTMQDQVGVCVNWLEAVLKAGGMSLSDVVEVQIYLSDIKNYAAMTEAYKQHFPNNPPTLAVIAVPRLPANSKIMLGLVAAKKPGRK